MENITLSDLPSQTNLTRIQKSRFVKKANGLLKQGFNKAAAVNGAVGSVLVQKAAGEEEMISYEIIYEPDTPDLHGQWMTAETIYKAKESYDLAASAGVVKENLFHMDETDSFSIESTWIQPEIDVTVPETGEIIKAGSWVAKVRYHDALLWELRKASIIGGLSIQCGGFLNEETQELTGIDFTAKVEYSSED